MKKISLILLLAVCFNFHSAFCQENQKRTRAGTVTAINLDKSTLSIERVNDKISFTFIVSKDILSKFKVGQFVKVVYTKTDKGDRIASKVEIAIAPADDKDKPTESPKDDKKNDDDLDIGVPVDPKKR